MRREEEGRGGEGREEGRGERGEGEEGSIMQSTPRAIFFRAKWLLSRGSARSRGWRT